MNRSVVVSWSIAGSLCLFGCAGDPAADNSPSRSGNGASGSSSSSTNNSSSGVNGSGNNSSSNNSSSSSSTGGSSASSSSNAGSSSTSNGGSSSSAAVDCSALPLPSNMDDVVATFEDGTGATLQVGGRGGGFYMFNDGTGMQMPPTGALPPATKVMRCDSTYALCTSGKGFTMWGAGLGTDLGQVAKGGDGGMGAKSTYDASMYKGISFWAKSNTMSVAVRVSIKDKNTAPEGGVCDAKVTSGATACNDDWGKALMFTADWKPYTIMFDDMRQAGWGAPYPAFDVKDTYSIQMQVSQNIDFDLCIDDLSFVR